MTDDAQTAREDLAFLRDLVDDDWRPGVWGFGALYLLIGVTLCAHVAVSYLFEGRPLLLAYLVLYSVFSVVMFWVSGRTRREMGPINAQWGGVKGRAGGAALAGAFAGHLVMLAVFVIVALRRGDGVFLELAPLVLFATQGAAWFVVHAMRRGRWQLLEAWGWLAAALALAPLVGTDWFGLGVGIAALVLMVLPGVYMMRLARS